MDIKRADYIGVRLECKGFATSTTDHTNHIRISHFKLIGITDTGETTALIDSADYVYMAKDTVPGGNSWRTTYRIYPVTQANNAWSRLTPEDTACIEQLLTHIQENQIYYSRAIWLAEDPGTRAARFDAISLAPLRR